MDVTRANRFVTIKKGSEAVIEHEIKRSKFLGFARRTTTENEARDFISELRKEHHEARHVCHAFVLGADREIQRSSDDGEPAGTAGIPMLDAIVQRQTPHGIANLSDVCVIVVRYFGGIKLGAGGLVQAYSGAAAGVLDEAKLVSRERMQLLSMRTPHAEAGRLETSLRALGASVQPTEYLPDHALITIAVRDDPKVLAEAGERIQSLTAGQGELKPAGKTWVDLPLK